MRRLLLDALKVGGWHAWGAESTSDFLTRAARRTPEMLLVHLNPADPQATDELRRLREVDGLGIVALAHGTSASERMRALDHGADHCLPAPPDPRELHSTLHALWRRVRGQSTVPARALPLEVGDWSLDPVTRTLRRASGASAAFSDQEVKLLAALIQAQGRVISRRELLAGLYPGDPSPDPHRIEVILSRARRKARLAGLDLPVRSVFGAGLAFLINPPPPG